MSIRDFFEVEGIQLEDGAAVFSAASVPTSATDSKGVPFPGGSVCITPNGVWQLVDSTWKQVGGAVAMPVGTIKRIAEGKNVLVEDGNQLVVYVKDFIIDGTLDLQGDADLMVLG